MIRGFSRWKGFLGSQILRARTTLAGTSAPESGEVLRLRNSLILPTGETNFSLVPLEIQRSQVLSWYSCGPTVYDSSHIGHARAYVCTDIIRRILADILELPVNFALGITDIDDKIIARANDEAKKKASKQDIGSGGFDGTLDWPAMVVFARKYEHEFFADMAKLGVRPPDAVLRVTEHLPEIVAFVERLLDQGQAYRARDGIYFDVDGATGKNYGKLGGNIPRDNTDDPEDEVGGEKSRVPSKKRGLRDFALWKFAKPNEPAKDGGSLGSGRPGWHIECSAMTHSYFGRTLDLHSGGVDLKFPHHTNEIAQSEAHNRCCDDEPWVRMWLHTGHIYIQGRKMSKSLKNFITIREYLAAGMSSSPAVDFRIFCLQHKYSSTLHFSKERMEEAAALRVRFENFHRLVALVCANEEARQESRSLKPNADSRALTHSVNEAQSAIRSRLLDDFDTPGALRELTEVVGKATLDANSLTMWQYGGVQALLAADALVRKYLGLLGLPELVPLGVVGEVVSTSHSSNAALSNASITATTASSSTRKVGSVQAPGASNVDIVDVLVELRSAVRGGGLQAIKTIKSLRQSKDKGKTVRAEKAKDESITQDTTVGLSVKETEATFSQMLQACDRARERAKAAGVVINDVGSGSTWRRA